MPTEAQRRAQSRRDLIGHWITKRQRTQQMCTHACCRGKRVHPENMPVILPNRLLRRASDDDLAEHFAAMYERHDSKAEEAKAQILDEMDRRGMEQHRRAERAKEVAQERRLRAFSRRIEHGEEEERIFREAEAYTRGNWVNKAGDANGISDREILTGSDATFARYASDEAKAYFADHPRPTPGYFRGEDTRYTPRYSPPRRRRQAGLPARPLRPAPSRPAATRTRTRTPTRIMWGDDQR